MDASVNRPTWCLDTCGCDRDNDDGFFGKEPKGSVAFLTFHDPGTFGGGLLMRGSISVEASIIVPFMLIILYAMLIGSLLIHDVLVLRANNAVQADAYVIAGQDTRAGQSVSTFIIKAHREESVSSGFFKDAYATSVSGSGAIPIVGLSMTADDARDYGVKNPKGFVRTIDFVDDATDVWTYSREIKEKIGQQLTDFKEIIEGK